MFLTLSVLGYVGPSGQHFQVGISSKWRNKTYPLNGKVKYCKLLLEKYTETGEILVHYFNYRHYRTYWLYYRVYFIRSLGFPYYS